MVTKTSKLPEIVLGIVSVVLVATAGVLLYFGKIDFNGAMLLFGLVAALWGVNGAYRAPSPQQQQALQTMMAQILETMPALINHIHMPAPAPEPDPVVPAPVTASTPPPAPAPAALSQLTAPMAALRQPPS